jgi:L-fuconolactonase
VKIDSHQHFWDPARGDYFWMDALTGEAARCLRRPILPGELLPLTRRHGISKTVLVQAAPTEAEAEFLLDLASAHELVAGVVIWLDLEAPGFEARLRAYADRPKLVGVRAMIQDIAEPEWMLSPAVRRSFSVLEEAGVCFDFLVKPPQMPALLRVLDGHPRLRAVIDHLAKPFIAAGRLDPWREQMRAAAAHPNVLCKLSGMITEADHASWTPADIAPYVQHVVGEFGPERCMFGSDWPVCTLAGSYDRVVAALDAALLPLGLSAEQQARIWGGSAAELYRL